ncbi:MAG: prepilin-type N-terminal cleavage/methylation domain-containing protein [Phycisphaera sp.]|nr:prepilin-type N-terminal cleavage/methylation domain-containing protein [Phycisphaera sp.]
MSQRNPDFRSLRGFTLTELMVAVVVLLVIILAVGRIFGTASDVVKAGEANADILQEISAIEQLVRNDLDRISDEGFLVVQCVAVRNDVMGFLGGGQLLDPTLPEEYIFRCDQIAFVADDLAISRRTQGMGAFEESGNSSVPSLYMGEPPTPQAMSSLIYYGHGFQLPFLSPNLGYSADPLWPSNGGSVIQPWFRPAPGQQRIDIQRWPQGSFAGTANGTQPPARNWTLARQEVLLADDYDGQPGHYMSPSFAGLFSNAAPAFQEAEDGPFANDAMRCGRVDVLSADIGRFRDAFRRIGPENIANELFDYRPRAEKRPPTLDKSDVLLIANVLGGNCSSVVIDWAWADGVGREVDLDLDLASGTEFEGAIRGVSHRGGIRNAVGGEGGGTIVEANSPLPWFGLGSVYGNSNLDVDPASSYLGQGFYDQRVRFHAPIAYDEGNGIFGGGPGGNSSPFGVGSSTVPVAIARIEADPDTGEVIERPYGSEVPVWKYRAVFGLNGKEPFVRDGAGRPLSVAPTGGTPWPVYRTDYTPWPSALRITATFHDAKGAIEGGRTVQFTVPLARRVQDLPED